MLRQNRSGVKLNAISRFSEVGEPHDFLPFASGGDEKRDGLCGRGGQFDCKRMIAPGVERTRHALKNPTSIMENRSSPPMQRLLGTSHQTAKCLTNALVAKADA